MTAVPSASRLAAVVDTGVYGAGHVSRTGGLAARYAPYLLGHVLVLSFQTVAELRYGAKMHTADRWIAATAIRYGLPLISDDAGFEGCPGLELIREAS